MINVIWFLLLTVGMVYFLLFNDATLLNKSLIFSINSQNDQKAGRVDPGNKTVGTIGLVLNIFKKVMHFYFTKTYI